MMKKVSWSTTWGSVVLLLICLVVVNIMAYFIPLRLDLTEERLYTISEGSRKILDSFGDDMAQIFKFTAAVYRFVTCEYLLNKRSARTGHSNNKNWSMVLKPNGSSRR